MPEQLIGVATQDGYVDAVQLGPAGNCRQLRFIGYNNAFAVQLFKYQLQPGNTNKTLLDDSAEYVYGANSGDVFGPEVAGARFRSYDPGKPASIFATLAYLIDPPASPIPPLVAVPSSSPEPGTALAIVAQGQVAGTNGTPTPLEGSSTECQGVSVKADPDNAGQAYLGDASVTTANGYILAPGDAVGFDVDDLATVFFDVDTTGDVVSFLAVG